MDAVSRIRAARVKTLAQEVGFDAVAITGPTAGIAYERYLAQMRLGYGADMAWLHENADAAPGEPHAAGLRGDVRNIKPDARSVIVLATSYASDTPGYLEQPPSPTEGWIARYAQGKDYHAHVRKMLVRLVRAMAADESLGDCPSNANRVFVDTGPVLEKAFAASGGLGWIGKNTLLLNRRLGSWLFLSVVLTPLELEPDGPTTDHCGSCTACLDVCPTDAFPEPFVLDARRCIATWTIESDAPTDVIRPAEIGQHIFGCDLCQEVCPWNRKVKPSSHTPLLPRSANQRPPLESLIGLDEASFKARFPKSSVRRVDAERLGAIAELIQRQQTEPTEPTEDGGPVRPEAI